MKCADVSPEEIVRMVESGELPSRRYGSFAEYKKAMET